MTINVLFVCMGNICRSPTADAVFQHKVVQAGLSKQIQVDSAGTVSNHVDAKPDKRAQAAGKKRGYNMSKLRARKLVEEDFQRFDYIMAMDLDNLDIINELRPADYQGNAGLFLQFLSDSDYDEVPDPYYGGGKGFELVLDLVEQGCDALLADVQAKL